MSDIKLNVQDGNHKQKPKFNFQNLDEKQLIEILKRLKEYERAIQQEYEKRIK